MIIPFTHPSPNSIPPYVSCFRSSFCFMFPFLFAFSASFYFRSPSPNPDPDICPILVTLICSLWYLYVPILMYVPQSETWHWLSLELTVQTSEPSSASRPKFEDSRHLVAQHISWSRVLAENIEPRYALGPSPAHNRRAGMEREDPGQKRVHGGWQQWSRGD